MHAHLLSIDAAIWLQIATEAFAYYRYGSHSAALGLVPRFSRSGQRLRQQSAVTNQGDGFDAGPDDGQDAAAGSNGDDGPGLIVGSAGASDGANETLTVKAERTTVTVNLDEAPPEVAVSAFLGDVPARVAWSVDRGDLAGVSPGVGSETAFVPTGSAGGQVTVTALVGKQQAHVAITVQLSGSQNGANPSIPGQASQIPSSVGKLTEGGGPGGGWWPRARRCDRRSGADQQLGRSRFGWQRLEPEARLPL